MPHNVKVQLSLKQRLLNSELGVRPPAHRGHRGLRPGGKVEYRNQPCARTFYPALSILYLKP
jgi:hypothetical protein